MLWNFLTAGSGNTAESAEPRPAETPKPEEVLPPFDAWLQAYRGRLEELCHSAGSRPDER